MVDVPDPQPANVIVHAGHVSLQGELIVPPGPEGMIVFAHGSGSGRHSPRNQRVARSLARAGFATLLFDLLTVAEEAADHYTADLRFDIPLLAGRLAGAIGWVRTQGGIGRLPVGLIGASTGAAAALIAATVADDVTAVVSRGGRPDLARGSLRDVRCPTLLIVGGRDLAVLELNQRAARQMTAPVHLNIVPGATHLFEEPGTLNEVMRLAASWFGEHLGRNDENRKLDASGRRVVRD